MENNEVLKEVKRKRGYLLSYHRMLGHTDPLLLSAYDNFYENLTLVPRALSPQQRELVWAGLLAATREKEGKLHMRRAVEVGLSGEILCCAVSLAGVAESLEAIRFGYHHWGEWIPQPPAEQRYRQLAETARGDIDPETAELILIVCHAAQRRDFGMRLHLGRAFSSGMTVAQLSEGLSYLLLPCGGPTLIEAVNVWERASDAGECPSPFSD